MINTSESETAPLPSNRKRIPWDKRIYLLLIGLILASAVKLVISWMTPGPLPPTNYPGIGGDFTLQSAHGAASLHDYRNKVVVVFFGYTHCPDICPQTLGNIAAAFRLLKGIGELEKVQGMFITLDPERDNVEKVSSFARYFHNRILGLTGTQEQIASVANQFKITYEKQAVASSALGYSIGHGGYIFIIRPDGSLGNLLSHTSTPKEITEAVRPWLDWAKKN
ncbi:MAG: SCO family protein [Gammaproteobacteria bacterium]|nr:SCO family protein [Gammaproteobacteria bacterium]